MPAWPSKTAKYPASGDEWPETLLPVAVLRGVGAGGFELERERERERNDPEEEEEAAEKEADLSVARGKSYITQCASSIVLRHLRFASSQTAAENVPLNDGGGEAEADIADVLLLRRTANEDMPGVGWFAVAATEDWT